jgi:hypothetical protein
MLRDKYNVYNRFTGVCKEEEISEAYLSDLLEEARKKNEIVRKEKEMMSNE